MKYKRILRDGTVDEVEGKSLKIADYPDFEFYVYKNNCDAWRCCEASVGCSIGGGNSRKEAVTRAVKQLLHYAPTQEKFRAMLNDLKPAPQNYKPFDRELRTVFMNAFGVEPMRFICEITSVSAMAQRIDIVAFDKWLQKKYHYEDGKTSCRDFVKTFGEDVLNAVNVFGGLT